MQNLFKQGLLTASLLVATQAGWSFPAEVSRNAGGQLEISWEVTGPVDVWMYTRGTAGDSEMMLISEGDTDGRHLQNVVSERPYVVLKSADGQQVTVAERLLPLAGGNNFRDLGGYNTEDGRTVKWGALYRSGTMTDLTDEDYGFLRHLGIAVVCDLRSTDERHHEPTLWRAEPSPVRLERDYELDMGEMMQVMSRPGIGVQDVKNAFADFYRETPFVFASQYRDMFARLLAGEYPLAFNCSAGKDRTGVGAALLLTALGVDRETVIADYLLSNQYYRPRATQGGTDDATSRMLAALSEDVIAVLMGVDRQYIEATFSSIEQRHGSVEAFLEHELGVDDTALQTLRNLYTQQ
jgi:protein-tyrosine phosphatase